MPFQEREKKGVKGTGLGLTIAKRIVEFHKARYGLKTHQEGGDFRGRASQGIELVGFAKLISSREVSLYWVVLWR